MSICYLEPINYKQISVNVLLQRILKLGIDASDTRHAFISAVMPSLSCLLGINGPMLCTDPTAKKKRKGLHHGVIFRHLYFSCRSIQNR